MTDNTQETNELIAAGTLFPGLTPERRAELERDLLAYIESDDPDSVAGDEWFRSLAGVDRQYVTLIMDLVTLSLHSPSELAAIDTPEKLAEYNRRHPFAPLLAAPETEIISPEPEK